MTQQRRISANLYFLGSGLLPALWYAHLRFLIFFWTRMGPRFGPPPPTNIYWKEFFRMTDLLLRGASATKLGLITRPLAIAVCFAWHERRKLRKQQARDEGWAREKKRLRRGARLAQDSGRSGRSSR